VLPLWIQNLGMGTAAGPAHDDRAFIVIISDAVVDVLNAATLSLPFEVERAYDVTRNLRSTGVKIAVLPETLAVSAPDLMPRKYFDWQVAIWVQQVATTDVADIDPLMLLVQEIIILFAFKPLPGVLYARCIGVENNPPLNHEHLHTKGMFTSGALLTFRWQTL
jgi:hypothetical protein